MDTVKLIRHRTELIGALCGKLKVLSYHHSTPQGKIYMECLCECGGYKVAAKTDLLSGKTRHCGCSYKKKTHNMVDTSTYRSWSGMIQRCTNSKLTQYKDYGGRGIKVCDSWLSFETFLADMGIAPDNHQIDRINNDGDYEPSNCRWATCKENQRNKRSSAFFDHNGTKKTLAQLSEESGIYRKTIQRRLNNGWTLDAAITAPSRNKKKVKRREEIDVRSYEHWEFKSHARKKDYPGARFYIEYEEEE